MRIQIVTTCTSRKAVDHPRRLTQADFAQGAAHVRAREAELRDVLLPAEHLYTGQQHQLLMRGVDALRHAPAPPEIDLWIVSAGYGLVPGDRPLAPYECTFNGMPRRAARAWADHLALPATFHSVVSRPYDFAIWLLGNEYFIACDIGAGTVVSGTTIALCSSWAAEQLTPAATIHAIPLSIASAKRHSQPLTALKGFLAGALLEHLGSASFHARSAASALDWFSHWG